MAALLHKNTPLMGVLLAFLLSSSSIAFSPPSSFCISTKRTISVNKITANPPNVAQSFVNHSTTFSQSVGLRMSSTAEPVEENRKDDIPLFEKFLVGIKRDFKLRLPLYKSDFKDAMKSQCVAATAFLFFACLAPAIGFGSLFGEVTNGAIGTMEMVSSTAICGMIYALTSAQPLTIIGSTGPVLAFVATLVQFAKTLNIPFLPFYAWTGLWTSAILFVSSLFSGSNGVKYLTRFTDEIFSTLISVIFIVEAVSDIGSTFSTSTLAKAILTLTCATVTYSTATILKGLRNTAYFTSRIRRYVSNFAPTIGVVFGALIARWARVVHGPAIAALPALSMPATFSTTSGRPWLVPLLDLPVWARFFSVLPALMATVLLYLDQNITVRLVNNPAYKMEKGRRPQNMLDGMNADMLIISLLTAFQSIVGIPWLVAATVRSISHVRALSIFDRDGNIVGTLEQRVTGLSIHTLIACCVVLDKPRRFVQNIPKSVLMGLFLYLGVSALPGNEMWERICGLFKDPKIAKEEKWSQIDRKKVTSFTLLQCACLAAMFSIKNSKIGVLFPVIIALLAPLRFGLEKFGFISKEDMAILDSDE